MDPVARVTPELLYWVESALEGELQALRRGHEAVVEHLQVLMQTSGVSEARFREPPTKSPDPELGTAVVVDFEPSEVFQNQFDSEKNSASEVTKSTEIRRLTELKKSPSSLKDSLTLNASPPKPFWHPDRFVKSCGFEVFFSFLIFLQAVSMAIEVQYTGLQWGYELNYQGYTLPAAEARRTNDKRV